MNMMMKVFLIAQVLLFPQGGLGFVPVRPFGARSHQLFASTMSSTSTAIQVEESTSTSTHNEPKLASSSSTEDSRFQWCDKNVGMWRTFVRNQGNDQDLRELLEIVRKGIFSSSALTRAYFASCGARTLFFATNGLLASTIASGGSGQGMMKDIAAAFRLLETVKCYQQELEAIEAGLLKYPWDFPVQSNSQVQWTHRQMNPLFVLSESLSVIQEASSILERKSRFQGKPSGQLVAWKSPSSSSSSSRAYKYPNYYLNDFHYQTDGWLSSSSAQKYEASSETIFIGSQDVMQRQAIIPLRKYFNTQAPLNLLEVACGTGRFSTFVRDHFPTTNVTLTDLSPFYLEKAKANDQYWRTYRGKQAMQEYMRSPASNREPAPVKLVQAQAEDLPFPDNSFEAVTCTYLFHELPGPVRAKVAKEMARVVQPGGMVVFADSVQVGDHGALGKLENFVKFNEPHYRDFVGNTNLASLFEQQGLICHQKYVNSRTKTLAFIKPM